MTSNCASWGREDGFWERSQRGSEAGQSIREEEGCASFRKRRGGGRILYASREYYLRISLLEPPSPVTVGNILALIFNYISNSWVSTILEIIFVVRAPYYCCHDAVIRIVCNIYVVLLIISFENIRYC